MRGIECWGNCLVSHWVVGKNGMCYNCITTYFCSSLVFIKQSFPTNYVLLQICLWVEKVAISTRKYFDIFMIFSPRIRVDFFAKSELHLKKTFLDHYSKTLHLALVVVSRICRHLSVILSQCLSTARTGPL